MHTLWRALILQKQSSCKAHQLTTSLLPHSNEPVYDMKAHVSNSVFWYRYTLPAMITPGCGNIVCESPTAAA